MYIVVPTVTSCKSSDVDLLTVTSSMSSDVDLLTVTSPMSSGVYRELVPTVRIQNKRYMVTWSPLKYQCHKLLLSQFLEILFINIIYTKFKTDQHQTHTISILSLTHL